MCVHYLESKLDKIDHIAISSTHSIIINSVSGSHLWSLNARSTRNSSNELQRELVKTETKSPVSCRRLRAVYIDTIHATMSATPSMPDTGVEEVGRLVTNAHVPRIH